MNAESYGKLAVIGECEEGKSGTKVTFLPDDTIFETTIFDFNVLKQRFREMAFLTKGLKIVLRDDREEEPKERTFHYEGGIKDCFLPEPECDTTL